MIRTTLRGLAAATVLLVAVSTTARAQTESSSRFGLNAGIALPMGDFGDAAELGFHLGGHIQMPLGETLKLRINGDFGYYGLPDGVDGNWTLLGAMGNIVLPITTSSALKPYVFGGLGMYNYKIDIDGLGSSDDTKLAFNIGAGYDFGKNFFTELRFLSIQTDGNALNTLPIVIGLRF
jgi:hypothetical protein